MHYNCNRRNVFSVYVLPAFIIVDLCVLVPSQSMMLTLIEKGRADINAQNKEGTTPLMRGASSGQVRLLLRVRVLLAVPDPCFPFLSRKHSQPQNIFMYTEKRHCQAYISPGGHGQGRQDQ
jgi:hypothetical protein